MPDRLSGAIIAAGRGDRLRTPTAGLPKPLVEIDGETLLARQVRLMLALGLDRVDVIINTETARRMSEIKLKLPDRVRLQIADTPNSMESLLRLGESIPAGRFLLATVDTVLTDHEFRRFFDRARTATADSGSGGFDGALGVVEWRGDKRPLFVDVAAGDVIVKFGDDDLGGKAPALVTAGVYLFSTRIFEHSRMAQTLALGALRQYLALLVERGKRFVAVPMAGVIDIDEPADLELARELVDRRSRGQNKVGGLD
jgi:NDP-sugar pyrophosphorylase family protein